MKEYIERIKPCPFCGHKAEYTKAGGLTGYSCSNDGCIAWPNPRSLDEWNSRPIEDQLQKELLRYKVEKDALQVRLDSFQAQMKGYRDGVKEGTEMLKDELRQVKAERDVLQSRLDIAVEALLKYRASGTNSWAAEALKKLEA